MPEDVGFSIIIYAKNEFENLQRHLPLWLNQQYNLFEIIIVDDCSTDETEDFLLQVKQQYPQVSFTKISTTNHHNDKKLAFTLGAKAAKYDWLLFSDASAAPVSEKWISSYQSLIRPHIKMIVGCNFYERMGKFSSWIKSDQLFSMVLSVCAAKSGHAYYADFYNFALHKSLFIEHKGFGTLHNLPTEETTFIVNTCRKNSEGNSLTEGMVSTHQNFSWKWWFLRKKELSALIAHSKRGTTTPFVELLSRLLYFSCIVTGVFLTYYTQSYIIPIILLLLILVRKVTITLLYHSISKRLHFKINSLYLLTLYDWFSPCFYIFLYFCRPNTVKIRKV